MCMTFHHITDLPKIVEFLGCSDYGEFGATTCPHCDAKGRYVYTFRCDDGTKRGAMAGCIRRFRVSPIADAHQLVMDKEKSGKKLNGWDRKIVEACERHYAGEISEPEALQLVDDQKRSRKNWMAAKGYRR